MTLVLAASFPTMLAAQPPPGRRERWPDSVALDLVATYRSGQYEEAVRRFMRLLRPRDGEDRREPQLRMARWVHAAEEETVIHKQRSWRPELEVLLLLATDALIQTWDDSLLLPAQGENPVWPPLDFLYDTVVRLEPGSPFLRLWYLTWEAFRQREINVAWAHWPTYFEDGLKAFPSDPEMLLAAGSYQELEWWTNTNQRRMLAEIPASRPADRRAELEAARKYLRRSVDADPTQTEPVLRLARVLLELDDLGGAAAVLDSRKRQSDEPAFEYLAALFQGAIAERRGDPATAIAAYERAIPLVPSPQSAWIGKAHALHTAGRRTEALDAATKALGGSASSPDPWTVYSMGQAWRLSPYLKAARTVVSK